MPVRSPYRRSSFIHVSPQNLTPFEFFDFRGLDMYTPDEAADDRRCPYGKNFRMYAPSDSSKRVSISKRLGHTFYTVPVGETQDQAITSTTGAADQSAGLIAWLGQPFTAGSTARLTKVDLNVKNSASGTGPLIVAIYSDSGGSPGTLLATSSILNSSFTGSYQYLSARFIEAPSLTSSSVYWIVAYVQADGTNSYNWSSNTSATSAKTSANSGITWSTTSFALNFKTYMSTSGSVKGLHRFYSSNNSAVTLMAFGTDVYTVNDGTGAVSSIKSGLSAGATHYDFATVNNKTYWVNGNDAPQVYDNATVAAAGGSPPTTSDNVEVHANRLFYLQSGTNYCVFSDAGSYETIGATSFLYIPSPSTADAMIKMVSYQGNLVFFSRNTKYVLYGTDLASFQVRESSAKKGAVSATAITKDDSYIYFLADDGHVYRYNGGTDEVLFSARILPLLKNAAGLSSVRLYVYDRKLFITYRPTGQSTNNNRLVFDLVYNEWLSDEDTYSNYGIALSSQTDTNQLVVASSLVGALYYGETGTNDVGKPIAFEYRTKYFSFGRPESKHRVKRYYVFLRSQTSNHTVDCQVDVDERNAPTRHNINVSAGGYTWGSSSSIWGSATWGTFNFLRKRISVPSANYKHQFRFVQSGVDNKVDLLGMSLYVQMKRAV